MPWHVVPGSHESGVQSPGQLCPETEQAVPGDLASCVLLPGKLCVNEW